VKLPARIVLYAHDVLKPFDIVTANNQSMAADKFTLIMTRGTHTVSATEAARILAAVENGDLTIDAEVEFVESLGTACRTTLVVAHVVGLVAKSSARSARSVSPKRHPAAPSSAASALMF
jgi:hypothetical protein